MTALALTEKRLAVRNYLVEQATAETGRGIGRLDVVAAQAKVSEGDLREIVNGHDLPSDEIVEAVFPLID